MGIIRRITHWKEAINKTLKEYNEIHIITEDERKTLQQVILNLFLEIFEMCENNNIDLFITGGAAIGALRHHGFIPWDDDIDCGIRRRDYARFVEVFQKEKGGKYIINAPNVSEIAAHRFTKIYIPGTVFKEIGTRTDAQMIGIDIFIIENVPNSKILRLIKGTRCNAVEFISGQVELYENKNKNMHEFYEKSMGLSYKVKMLIGRTFSFMSSSKWYEHLDRISRWDDESSKDCSIVSGRKHYFGETAPREVYFPASEALFCGNTIKVFNDEDKYLSIMYGDYMSIPPIEKREQHYISELDFGEILKEGNI